MAAQRGSYSKLERLLRLQWLPPSIAPPYSYPVKVTLTIIFLIVVVKVIFYFSVYVLIAASSSLFGLCGLLYISVYSTATRPIQPKRAKVFTFLDKVSWIEESDLVSKPSHKSIHSTLSSSSDLFPLGKETPIIPESFLISETVNDLINLIIKSFIDGWFESVSKNRYLFQDKIHDELGIVINNLKDRLSKLDFAKLLVTQFLPLLHEHFVHFLKADEIVRNTHQNIKAPLSNLEYDIAIANNYNRGKLNRGVSVPARKPSSPFNDRSATSINTTHSASTTSSHHTNNNNSIPHPNDIPAPSSNVEEKKFFRNQVESILPFLLSKEESSNKIVIGLVREILSCTILTNVFSMLRESDFYNVLIVKLIGDNLQHRTQVKQLREALAEHTKQGSSINKSTNQATDSSSGGPSSKLDSSSRVIDPSLLSLPYYSFSEATDYVTFKTIYEGISKVNSIEQLKQLDNFFSAKLPNASAGTKYEKRLKLILGKIKQNQNNLKLSVANNSQDINLTVVLDNKVASKSFQNFLELRNEGILLEFWKDVESIKAPLEDAAMDDDEDYIEDNLSLSLAYSNSEDMIRIYKKYFYNSTLAIRRSSIEVMEEYITVSPATTITEQKRIELYRKARKELIKVQGDIFQRLQHTELTSFKKSEKFFKLLEVDAFGLEKKREEASRSNFSPIGLSKQSDLSNNPLFVEKESDNETVNEASSVAVKAVEDAFTEIMKNSTYKHDLVDKEADTSSLSTKADSTTSISDTSADIESKPALSTIHMKRDLFGEPDPTSLFGDDVAVNKSNVAIGNSGSRYSKLFDDDESDAGNETDDSLNYDVSSPLANSMEFDNPDHGTDGDNEDPMSSSEIFLAAPGNLNLAEEIARLDQEIEKLNEQMTILTPLLNKAELTNNVGELKILRKSKISLDREISYNELQKQQYIVQENDNSLYNKSRLSIQSYIIGSDGGREVILYIVEVQKLSNENPESVSAGWIVARRYSQFYKLNEYLKLKYPQVNNAKFPKRTVSVLKFQQKQVVELRKIALEEYLQEIIKIPEVCSDRAFRAFLSSENFNVGKSQSFEESLRIESNRASTRNSIEMVANKLYGQTKQQLLSIQGSQAIPANPLSLAASSSNINSGSMPVPSVVDKTLIKNITEMQNELKLFDASANDTKESFVKPICDILIAVFKLNTSKTWLRGRALLVILQQIFGTTIERKCYEMVEQQLRNEENILDILTLLQRILFPNGKFKDPPVIRTLYERSTSKQEAKVLFDIFFQETCAKLFGQRNTSYASTNIFKMLQNDFLNEHLLFEVFNLLIEEIFPETK